MKHVASLASAQHFWKYHKELSKHVFVKSTKILTHFERITKPKSKYRILSLSTNIFKVIKYSRTKYLVSIFLRIKCWNCNTQTKHILHFVNFLVYSYHGKSPLMHIGSRAGPVRCSWHARHTSCKETSHDHSGICFRLYWCYSHLDYGK